jgi:hypothetical protein
MTYPSAHGCRHGVRSGPTLLFSAVPMRPFGSILLARRAILGGQRQRLINFVDRQGATHCLAAGASQAEILRAKLLNPVGVLLESPMLVGRKNSKTADGSSVNDWYLIVCASSVASVF